MYRRKGICIIFLPVEPQSGQCLPVTCDRKSSQRGERTVNVLHTGLQYHLFLCFEQLRSHTQDPGGADLELLPGEAPVLQPLQYVLIIRLASGHE